MKCILKASKSLLEKDLMHLRGLWDAGLGSKTLCPMCCCFGRRVDRYFADQLWSEREETATVGRHGCQWDWGARTAQMAAGRAAKWELVSPCMILGSSSMRRAGPSRSLLPVAKVVLRGWRLHCHGVLCPEHGLLLCGSSPGNTRVAGGQPEDGLVNLPPSVGQL